MLKQAPQGQTCASRSGSGTSSLVKGTQANSGYIAHASRLLQASALGFALMLSSGMSATASETAFLPVRMDVAAPLGAKNLCRTYSWACLSSGSSAPLTATQVSTAQQINTRINRTVTEISDQAQYGRPEVWALPTARGGDCEDFALLKKRDLIALGLPADRLLIATVLDRNRVAHAILVLRTPQGDYVLDNLTDSVLHWTQTGYTFLRMQDPADQRKWAAVIAGGIMKGRDLSGSMPVSSIGLTASGTSGLSQ